MDKTFGVRDPQLTYLDRPGAYIIEITEGHLACVQTTKGIFLLGGGLEQTESHTACIMRECLEEIGCTVSIETFLCAAETYCIHPRIGPFHPIQFYYLGRVGHRIQPPIEHDHTFLWLPLDQLDKLYVPQQIWAVQYALQKEF